MIYLRQSDKKDIKEIATWPSYEGEMKQMDYALRGDGWLAEFQERPGTRIYAALHSHDLIGFSILIRESERAEEAEFRIALRADRTGRGMGEQVALLTLRKGFEEERLTRIHLIVRKNHPKAISLYNRIGFRLIGEKRREIRNEPVDFLFMEMDADQFHRLKRE